MASIDKRGDYQWRVRINRKGYRVAKTFSYKEDAEKWARKVEGEIDRGIFLPSNEAEKTSLADALDRYVDTVSRKKKGDAYTNEKSKARVIKRHQISKLMLTQIRSSDIARYIADREKQVKNNTIRLELALISHLYTIAAASWEMDSLHNPVKTAMKPSVKNDRRERRLSPGEEELLLNGCDEHSLPWWLKPCIVLALETAMRRQEIAQMHRQWISLERSVVYIPVESSKTKIRTVPLSPRAIHTLQTIPTRIDGRVFNILPQQISRQFKALCRHLNISDLHFHDLRHEATTRLFEHGWSMTEVMAMTGHSTAQMANRYTHLEAHNLVEKLHNARPFNAAKV